MYNCQVNLWEFPCIVWDISHAHKYQSLTRARARSLSPTHTFTLTLTLTISASHTGTFTHTHTHIYQHSVPRCRGWLAWSPSISTMCEVEQFCWTKWPEPGRTCFTLHSSSTEQFISVSGNSSVSSACSVSACTTNTEEWPISSCFCKPCMCVCCVYVCVSWPCASSSLVSSLALLRSGLISVKTCFSSVSLASSLALLRSGLVSDVPCFIQQH